MVVSDAPHAVCCIQADIADVLHRLDNVHYLDTDIWTSHETVRVQPFAM